LSRVFLRISAVLFFGFLVLCPWNVSANESVERTEIRIKPLPGGARKVFLVKEDGLRYEVLYTDGRRVFMSPREFTDALEASAVDRPALFRIFNISSSAGIAWVMLGFLGQVLFTGRMVFQWLVSEKARRSVVPVGFWWMSMGGASMLLVYFIWRKDIVGVLGQSTGWFIYSRNLWLIYRPGA